MASATAAAPSGTSSHSASCKRCHLLTKNPHFGHDWGRALRETFAEAQRDLLDWAVHHNVNVEGSGATGSIAVLAGQTLHIAHISDSTAVLACWNRHDTRLIHKTEDHKPEHPQERARLGAHGNEVREVDEGAYRIYLSGSSFPGLTMSRSFGDTACAGVTQEPSYEFFQMQPWDENYLILASDGVWEFIEPEKAVDLMSKKLRLKGPAETLRFIFEASRKRWAAACGDYCDDITALLVQWNVHEKDWLEDVDEDGALKVGVIIYEPCTVQTAA